MESFYPFLKLPVIQEEIYVTETTEFEYRK